MLQARHRFGQYLCRRYGDRSTPKHYLNDLDMFIQQIGDKPPEAVIAGDVDQFVTAQMERGLRATTINRRIASLHSFFEYLASEAPDTAGPNPVQWRRHGCKQGVTIPRDATESEVIQLFAVIEDQRDRAMFGLMVGAGLRVGEVAALQCADLEEPTTAEESARSRVSGKGRKERIVWVTPRWWKEVKQWLASRPQAGTDHLFLNQHGRPLSVAGIQYRLKGHCRQANIHITCHQLRHTFARRLAEQRMPIESISQLLGHAQIKTTQRYTAGADPDLRDAFLATMAAVEEAEPATPTLPPLPRGPVIRETADETALHAALERFHALPDWLQPVLNHYLKQRWYQWQPHLAARHAHSLSQSLLRIWQWLVTERQLSAWSDLQRSDIEAWLTAQEMAGVQVSSRRTYLSTLMATLHHALEQDVPLAANVFRVSLPVAPRPLPRYLPPDHYERLVKTVQQATLEDSPRAALDRAWFLTLAHTGIRCCELLNLRLGDIDFTTRRLFIRSSKNGDERVVYLTATLTQALAHYLTYRPAEADDHLWWQPDKPLKRWHVRYRLRCWGKACGLTVTPHRLRHTFATQLLNHGMPIASVGKLLGHRTLTMTQRYASLYEQTVKEQFVAATAHIEGIIAPEWPKSRSIEVPTAPLVEHSVDSV